MGKGKGKEWADAKIAANVLHAITKSNRLTRENQAGSRRALPGEGCEGPEPTARR